MFCTPLTAVINFESRDFLLFLLGIRPDTQDYYSFLEFSQSVFSSHVGLAWLGKLKDPWERVLLLKTMFYTFSSNKIGKWPCHKRDNALQNCKYVHICWSFYNRFTSKQCNVCLYLQLTTHLASCREIGNCGIKVVQLITGRSRRHYFHGVSSTWVVPKPWCEDIHQRSISHREDHLGGKKTRTTDSKKERPAVFENLRHKEKTSQTKVQILWFFRFWLDIEIAWGSHVKFSAWKRG